MRHSFRATVVIPAAVLALAMVSGCSSGSTPTVSTDTIRSSTSADVVNVLTSKGVTVKGTLNCQGRAPLAGKVNVFDCSGTTSDGKSISSTLNASVSGKSCTGPMVVNVDNAQIASLPNEKCS